jgi:hypothetical protein
MALEILERKRELANVQQREQDFEGKQINRIGIGDKRVTSDIYGSSR